MTLTDFRDEIKMTNKRSRLEIFLDVLRVINNGTQKPTHIMYRSNLSWVPLNEVLESLLAQGLVIKEERPSKARTGRGGFSILSTKVRHPLYDYKITEKGRNVLRYFDKAKEVFNY